MPRPQTGLISISMQASIRWISAPQLNRGGSAEEEVGEVDGVDAQVEQRAAAERRGAQAVRGLERALQAASLMLARDQSHLL